VIDHQPFPLNRKGDSPVTQPLIGLPPSVDPDAWRGLLALAERQTYRRGETIFEDRSEGDRIYVILDGPVEILKEAQPGHDVRLAILETGTMFGERSLFGDTRRSATARAYGPVELLSIPATAAKDYLEAHPVFAMQFYRTLCERFSQLVFDLDSDIRSLHHRLSFL
jgi:CRP-like cAMP-binding protein